MGGEDIMTLKILVAVKRVVDHSTRIRVRPDGGGVDLANVKMAMNPFDEIALEEAVRLKESGVASEVAAVTIGSFRSEDVLRSGLAMGADRAILIRTDATLEPLAVAKLLKALVVEERPDMVLLGKQAIDDDNNQTGQMLAALLGWGQATFASRIHLGDGWVNVTREVDGGLQTLSVPLPAIITTDLRLNQPRYASLPNIMKAKKKPIEERVAEDFNVDLTPKLKILATEPPAPRPAGMRVGDVPELVARLRAMTSIFEER